MPEQVQVHAFDELATRDGFNRSLRHFKFISRVISEFESKKNIADILGQSLAEKSIEPRQVLPTLNAILVDKYHYACRSHNLADNFDGFDGLVATVATWKGVDVVVVYFHPELGVVVVNPKNRDHWEGVRSLKKNELVTVFPGGFPGTDGDKKYETAISLLISLMEGGKAKSPSVLQKGTFVFKKPARVAAPAPAAPRAPRKAARAAGPPSPPRSTTARWPRRPGPPRRRSIPPRRRPRLLPPRQPPRPPPHRLPHPRRVAQQVLPRG